MKKRHTKNSVGLQNSPENSNAQNVGGRCTLCQEPASHICNRCNDFYCSLECQSADWQRHRHICFPMPALVLAPIINRSETVTKGMPSPPLFTGELSGDTPELFGITGEVTQNQPKAIDEDMKRANKKQKPQQIHAMTMETEKPESTELVLTDKETVKIRSVGVPPQGSSVFVSGFDSSNSLYVRACSPEAETLYINAMNRVQSAAMYAHPLTPNKVTLGMNVLIKYLQSFWRGRIDKLQGKASVGVRLLDSGYYLWRPVVELYEMPLNLLDMPKLAVHVHLKNVDSVIKFPQLKAFLSKYLKKKFTITYTGTVEPGAQIELHDCNTNRSVNDEIRKFCADTGAIASRPGGDNLTGSATAPSSVSSNAGGNKSPNTLINGEGKKTKGRNNQNGHDGRSNGDLANNTKTSNGSSVAPFKQEFFTLGATNVEVTVMDASALAMGFVACIAPAHLKDLQEVQAFLTTHQDDVAYKPSIGEFCIALFEEEWYRAKIVSIEDDNYTVLYPDFTNVHVVKSDEIRRYPPDLTIPCYTNLCLIHGLPSTMTQVQVNFLQSKIKEHKRITFDKIQQILDSDGEQTVSVELKSLIQEMKDEGLL